jgi:hypothetical protein
MHRIKENMKDREILWYEKASAIVIPWVYYNTDTGEEECDIYQILILDRIHDNRIWHCLTLDGKRVNCDASGAAMKKSEGKRGIEWLEWAENFRKEIMEMETI